MRSRVATLALVALVPAAALSACGGASDNGVSSKSADAIVSAATDAAGGAKSVHVSGSVVSGGSPITMDLNLASGKGGSGHMSQNGLSFQIVAVGQTVYINGSDAFWSHFGGAPAVQLFHGRWLKAPATGQLASIALLTNVQQLFQKLLSNHGALTKGATSTVNGQKVVAVNDTAKGGTLYVATTGKPYPVEITGAQSVRIDFGRFDQSVSLSAPPNSIDISQLKTGTH